MSRGKITLSLMLLRQTDLAVLVEDEDQTQAWLPKSQIEIEDQLTPGDVVDVVLPTWLAQQSDLVW